MTQQSKYALSLFFALLFACGGLQGSHAGTGISDRLAAAMEKAEVNAQTVRALVVLSSQVDIKTLDHLLYKEAASPGERAFRVISELRNTALNSQTSLISFLNNQPPGEIRLVRTLWVVNLIVVEATPSALIEIQNRSDVWYLDLDAPLTLDRPETPATPPSVEASQAEIGLRAINAHKLWTLGFTGTGRLLMNIDTGVDISHPAVSHRWRGNHVPAAEAWFDPESGSTVPADCDEHGTHTMGTMIGLDPASDDTIGVAFGAEWIAARTLCTPGAHTSNTLAAFQWALDPDNNPGTISDMPDAICNSWNDPDVGFCDITYAMTFDALEAAGIALVFAAGNNGPDSLTITAPKNINTNLVNTMAVGAVNAYDPAFPIAVFGISGNTSSHGPSQCGGSGSLSIKPEVVAPGWNVRSSILNGEYGFRMGTSMASPHVTGAIALLKQAFPNKTGHQIKTALYQTARETLADDDPGEDNAYGNGLIDVYAAFQSLKDPEDPEDPKDVSAFSDFATPNSILLTWTDPAQLIGGGSLNDFEILIIRNGITLPPVNAGTESFIDSPLVDGSFNSYQVFTRDRATDSVSFGVSVGAYSGGDPVPSPPSAFTITKMADGQLLLQWKNPSRNADKTALDDFSGIRIYENGQLVADLNRSAQDTSNTDSVFHNPPGTIDTYWLTAYDNEVPENESEPGSASYTPLFMSVYDPFEQASEPDPRFWFHSNTEISDQSVNPPSSAWALALDGHPVGHDTLSLRPIPLTGLEASDVTVSFWYQPQGNGNRPEPKDSLFVDFLNDAGIWRYVRGYTGESIKPFEEESIDPSDEDPGLGQTFFHEAFQVRFRNNATASLFDNPDVWFVDDFRLDLPVSISPGGGSGGPRGLVLLQNYPNPFNPSTTISFYLSEADRFGLNIYNVLGERVRVFEGRAGGGHHSVTWDGKNEGGRVVASGVYFYRLQWRDRSAFRKMLLLR